MYKIKRYYNIGISWSHTERRLDPLMFIDGDYEHATTEGSDEKERPNMSLIGKTTTTQ